MNEILENVRRLQKMQPRHHCNDGGVNNDRVVLTANNEESHGSTSEMAVYEGNGHNIPCQCLELSSDSGSGRRVLNARVFVTMSFMVLMASVSPVKGNKFAESSMDNMQLRRRQNHPIATVQQENKNIDHRRDQDCSPPAAGCGNGIWSDDKCECMCVPPYCFNDLFQTCATVGSCANPFEGCTSGLDCPYYPDPGSGTCIDGSSISPGVYNVFWDEEECCNYNYPGSTTCYVKVETSSPTSSPSVPPTMAAAGVEEEGGGLFGDGDDGYTANFGMKLPLIPMYFYDLPSSFELNDTHIESLEYIVTNAAGQYVEALNVELISINIVDEFWERKLLGGLGATLDTATAEVRGDATTDRMMQNTTDSKSEGNTTTFEFSVENDETTIDEAQDENNVLTLWIEVLVMESLFEAEEVRSMVMRVLRDHTDDIVGMLRASWTSEVYTADVSLEIGDIDAETYAPTPRPTSALGSTIASTMPPRDDIYNEGGGKNSRFLPLWIVIIFVFLFLALFGGLLHWQKKQDIKLFMDSTSVVGSLSHRSHRSHRDDETYRTGATSKRSKRDHPMIKMAPSQESVAGSRMTQASNSRSKSSRLAIESPQSPSAAGSVAGASQFSYAKSSTFSYMDQPSIDFVDDAQEKQEGDLMQSYIRRRSQEEEDEQMNDGYDAEKSSYLNSFGDTSNASSFNGGNRGVDPDEDEVSKESGGSVLGLLYYAGGSSSEDENTQDPLESKFGRRRSRSGATSSRSSRVSRKSARSKSSRFSSDGRSSSSKTAGSRRRKQNSLHKVDEASQKKEQNSHDQQDVPVGYQQHSSFDSREQPSTISSVYGNNNPMNAAGTCVSQLTTDSSFLQSNYIYNIHGNDPRKSYGDRKSSVGDEATMISDRLSASGLSLTVDSTGDYIL